MRNSIRTVFAAAFAIAVLGFSFVADGAVTKSRLGSLRRDDLVVTDVTGGSGGGISNLEEVVSIVTNFDAAVVAPRERKTVLALLPRRLGPYLWEIGTTGEDFAQATNRMSKAYPSYRPYGCTGFCNNRFHGRNLDWYYDRKATVLVRSPAKDGKHGVLGVVCGTVDDAVLERGVWEDAYWSLPFSIGDGINDAGVVIQQNVIPRNDVRSSSWRASSRGRIICFCMIRYALDRCGTARAAAELIRDKVFVPSEFSFDIHYLVSDRTSSFIVEDGQIYEGTIPTDAMTNFRVGTASFNEDRTVRWETVESYGIGLERYDALRTSDYDVETAVGMAQLMRDLWYTRAYETNAVPYWYTEHCDASTPELTVMAAKTNQALFAEQKAAWKRDLDREHDVTGSDYRKGTTWQTVHTSVYDKDQLKVTLFTQEDPSSVRDFRLIADKPLAEEIEEVIRTYDGTNLTVRLDDLFKRTERNRVSIEGVAEYATNIWITVDSYITYFEKYCTNNYLAARLANYRAKRLEAWQESVSNELLLANAPADQLKPSAYFSQTNAQLVATIIGEATPIALSAESRAKAASLPNDYTKLTNNVAFTNAVAAVSPPADFSTGNAILSATITSVSTPIANNAAYIAGVSAEARAKAASLPNDYTKLTNNAAFRQGVEAVSPPVDVQGVIDENIRTQNLCTVAAAQAMTNGIPKSADDIRNKLTDIGSWSVTQDGTFEGLGVNVSSGEFTYIKVFSGASFDCDVVSTYDGEHRLSLKANADDVYTRDDADEMFLANTGGTMSGKISMKRNKIYLDYGEAAFINSDDDNVYVVAVTGDIKFQNVTRESYPEYVTSTLTPDGSSVLTKTRGDDYYLGKTAQAADSSKLNGHTEAQVVAGLITAPTATNIAEYVFDTQKPDFVHYEPDVNSNRTALTLGTRATVAGTPAWSASATYQQGDTVVHDGVVYVCIVSPREVVSPSPWGTQYTMWKPVTVGPYSMSVGVTNIASGVSSHAEGSFAHAEGQYAHAEGLYVRTDGIASHAEGQATRASGLFTHAEGLSAMASGMATHAEGNNTTASGVATLAAGVGSTASGYATHAEGHRTVADGLGSHAEGSYTRAGSTTVDPGDGTSVVYRAAAHAEGWGAVATNQTAFVWQGLDGSRDAFTAPTVQETYHDHGAGTFNVNPVGGLGGFYIGSQALSSLIPQVENSLTSTDTSKALSANMGRELKEALDNMSARGRYLSLWNCTNGVPYTNPTVSPYDYRTGDYYIVGVVDSLTNYSPSGASYVIGTASTNRETGVVQVNDTYYYDGTSWTLVHAEQREVSFASLAGVPDDNAALKAALDEKMSFGYTDNYGFSTVTERGTVPYWEILFGGTQRNRIEFSADGQHTYIHIEGKDTTDGKSYYVSIDPWGFERRVAGTVKPKVLFDALVRTNDMATMSNMTDYPPSEKNVKQYLWDNYANNYTLQQTYLTKTDAQTTYFLASDISQYIKKSVVETNYELKTNAATVAANNLTTAKTYAKNYADTLIRDGVENLAGQFHNCRITGDGRIQTRTWVSSTWEDPEHPTLTVTRGVTEGHWTLYDSQYGETFSLDWNPTYGRFDLSQDSTILETWNYGGENCGRMSLIIYNLRRTGQDMWTTIGNVAKQEDTVSKSTKISGISLSNDVEIADIPLKALKLVDEDTGTKYLLKVKSGALKLYSISE